MFPSGTGRRLNLLHLLPRAFDRLADLCCLSLGLNRQPTDLVGNYRESPAGLAGPCGFDRSVEREQLRLPGDALDDPRQRRDVPQLLPYEAVEQIGDYDALLTEFADRVDHASDHGQPSVCFTLELLGGGRRFARRDGAALGAVPERAGTLREILGLAVQVLDLGFDHLDRHRTARGPNREIGHGRAEIIQRDRDVAGHLAGFAGPLGENSQVPRPVAVMGLGGSVVGVVDRRRGPHWRRSLTRGRRLGREIEVEQPGRFRCPTPAGAPVTADPAVGYPSQAMDVGASGAAERVTTYSVPLSRRTRQVVGGLEPAAQRRP